MKYFFAAVITQLIVLSNDYILAAQSCPDSIQNAHQCSQYQEKMLAKNFPHLFSREGRELVISLAKGNKKIFLDIPDEEDQGEQGRWFNIVQYYPEIGYALVAVHYYEGGTHYLVNLATGEFSDIISIPVISPDWKRIAVANEDLVADYTQNVLSVFRLHPDGLKQEFQVMPKDWGPRNLQWDNNQALSFVEYRLRPLPKSGIASESLVGKPRKLRLYIDDNSSLQEWIIE